MEKERLSAFTDAFISYALSFFWLGTMWVELHQEWHEVKKISNAVVWWNIVLLFFASLVPYATSLVYRYFTNSVMQGFYGIVIIIISVTNIGLRHSLGKANPEDHDMLNTMQRAKKILFADIVVKMVGLIIAVVIYPQAMMLSVLITLIVFVMTHQVLAR